MSVDPLRTKAARRSRRRGGSGEREVVAVAHAHGFTEARRNFGSGAQGGGDVTGIPGCAVEVKYQESLNIWKALAQCENDARPTDTPVVAFRRNGSGWYCALPLDDLMALLMLREAL